MKKMKILLIIIICLVLVIIGYRFIKNHIPVTINEEILGENNRIRPTTQINKIDNGLSTVRYDGDYGFDNFISHGGASSDKEVINFLIQNISKGFSNIEGANDKFGCSTISVKDSNGDNIFGRNFDWYNSEALIVVSKPTNGYKSISTVNMNFITQASIFTATLSDEMKTMASLYAPLDGMNEKGLCISVNYIEDSAVVEQNTSKPDITTTTAIRLLLNKAADTDEAIELLKQYDMHSSMGWMTHFAITDNKGNSKVVEYVNNEMKVLDTPVVTNFYLDQGEKYGIGTAQSHERYETLIKTIENKQTMNMEDVRDALNSVDKSHWHDGEITEWSVVYNQTTGDINYYHRQNFDKVFKFNINE